MLEGALQDYYPDIITIAGTVSLKWIDMTLHIETNFAQSLTQDERVNIFKTALNLKLWSFLNHTKC